MIGKQLMITDHRQQETHLGPAPLRLHVMSPEYFVGHVGKVVAYHKETDRAELCFPNYLTETSREAKVYIAPDRLAEPDPLVVETVAQLNEYRQREWMREATWHAEINMAASILPNVLQLTAGLSQGQIWDLLDILRPNGVDTTLFTELHNFYHDYRIKVAWVDRTPEDAPDFIKQALTELVAPYNTIFVHKMKLWDEAHELEEAIMPQLIRTMDTMTVDQRGIVYRALPDSTSKFALFHRYYAKRK